MPYSFIGLVVCLRGMFGLALKVSVRSFLGGESGMIAQICDLMNIAIILPFRQDISNL